MGGRQPPRVFTVPPGARFLDRVADFLLSEIAGADAGQRDFTALSSTTVYLPTRRAARALGGALHRAAGGAVLLPRIRGLGEGADEDDPARFGSEKSDDEFSAHEVVSETERRMVLADIARQWARTTARWADRTPEIGPHPVPANPGEAVALAADLARLLDEMAVAGADRQQLEGLVPEDLSHLARNWRINLEFLTHATDRWDDHLARRGLEERVGRRDRGLHAEAERLTEKGSPDLVVAAGSTGSVPAAAALMKAIAGLAKGAVILPGLDTELDDESWCAVGPDHPQFGIKRLIETFGISRSEVRQLGGPDPAPLTIRRRLVSEAMRPAETTDAWMRAIATFDAGDVRAALRTTALVEALDEHEEARVIALMLRRAANEDRRLTALVTPDRGLARRVAAELARWNMTIDDSGGRPLDQTRQGVFLRLVGDAARSGFAPLPTLALLKHPLTRLSLEYGQARHAARVVELAALRGGRPAAGIAEIAKVVERAASTPSRHPVIARLGPADYAAGVDLLNRLEAAFAPLTEHFTGSADVPARALLTAHVEAAEAAAQSPAGEAPALWRDEAGEALAVFLAEALSAAGEAAPLNPGEFANWLAGLMRGQVVRQRRVDFERVVIWGPLEARMQRADRVILAGLNEGTWPAETETDPWFGRPMRAALGLEPPERRIGLQAHDVVEGLMADEVVLTRAQKSGGAPAVPSRWLWRLRALLEGMGIGDALEPEEPWLAWVRSLDEADAPQPCPPPRPAPPIVARPSRLSVTRIETWIRDPYAIYARSVLGLERLEAIDAPPDAADYGQIIHGALARLIADNPQGPLAADALTRLMAVGREAFGAIDHRPGLRAYWWLRFERVARWFIDLERDGRQADTRSHTEVNGSIAFVVPDLAQPFTLTARADRIDIDAEGRGRIVDYKTGRGPGDKEIASMLAPQLPLEAMILEQGGFEGVAGIEAAALAHISLTGREPAGEVRPVSGSPHALAEDARGRLMRLVSAYADPARPYLSRIAPQREDYIGDYDHLARVGEWSLGLGRRHGG